MCKSFLSPEFKNSGWIYSQDENDEFEIYRCNLGVVAKGSWEKLSCNDSLQYYDTSYQDALKSYKSLESKRDELIGHLDSFTGFLRLNNVSRGFILKNLEKLEISLIEFKLKLEGSVGE